MGSELVLGVDFGSSSTSAGVLVGDRIQLLQDQGDSVIPSVVYVPDRGPMEVGRRATVRQLTEPSNVIRSVKRVLGLSPNADLVRRYSAGVPYPVGVANDRLVFKLRSGDVTAEQIAACVLTRVRELAETRFGGRATKMVMTMSAAAPAGYCDAARRAAKLAHLEVVDFIAEPIAGALALDLHRQNTRRNIVVCDFGGGTFDVSAVVQNGLAFTPIATHGDHYLGGDDLDDAMAEAIAATVYRTSQFDMHRDAVRWQELLFRCESAKRQLSSRAEAPLHMRDAYIYRGERRALELLIDGPWVRQVWSSLLDRVRVIVGELLLRAGWTTNDVDVVGLIGGSSLVPAFRELLAAGFGQRKLLVTPDAEIAVAQGATLLTARHRKLVSDQIPVLVDATA